MTVNQSIFAIFVGNSISMHDRVPDPVGYHISNLNLKKLICNKFAICVV